MPTDQRATRRDTDERAGTISFASLDAGVELVDPIDRRRYTLSTPAPVAPDPASTDAFRFPVDAATRITTDAITLPTVVAVCVRDEDGAMLAKTEHFAHEEFDADTYSIELCAPIRIYLRVGAGVTVTADTERTRIEFDRESTVLVGARSKHEHPVATVTTTRDPADVMTAVSTFGSALKTTSPERSYPTFRGHPPTIEVGESLTIPQGLDRPETGVRIEVPPEYRYVYPVASLAYYLGARVVPGETPRLVTERGFDHSLSTDRSFEREVERVLKQLFVLDCITRTEGLYRIDLYERRQVEERVDLDPASLYQRSLAEQVAAYLDVPFAHVEEHCPDWKLTAHITPEPSSAETLPFLVNDLAVIQTPTSTPATRSEVAGDAVDEFLRDRDSFTRQAAAGSPSRSYVQPEAVNSIEQAWVGEETPVGANKATPAAYRNRFDRTPSEDDIDITVVSNDREMDEERSLVDEVYGSRGELPFDVTVRRDLAADELADVFAAQTDLVHYIGHIDENGFECPDGTLDAEAVSDVGTDAFLLNACQSYEQGMALIEAGAIGGIVTLSDVINDGAVTIGSAIARLLNCGFPLRAALDIAKDESIVGGRYIVIGDGGLTIAQSPSGAPNFCEIERTGETFSVTMRTFATTSGGMGGVIMPCIESNDAYYLNSGDIRTFDVSRDGLKRFFELENIPLQVNGRLRWSDEIAIEEI